MMKDKSLFLHGLILLLFFIFTKDLNTTLVFGLGIVVSRVVLNTIEKDVQS